MNAIEKNQFSQSWESLGNQIGKPQAILSVSAHWETSGTWVTAMEHPRTIHDFGNFPQALFDMQYPAKGDPKLAKRIQSLVTNTPIGLDVQWGLDHGTWSVLTKMYPEADIPVLQLSLNTEATLRDHYAIGKELKLLRDEGVLILGSGNIVHNLNLASRAVDDEPEKWAVEFDETIKQFLIRHNHQGILDFENLGDMAHLSVPTLEHFLPLIYIIGMQEQHEQVTFPIEGIVGKAFSMRSAMIS